MSIDCVECSSAIKGSFLPGSGRATPLIAFVGMNPSHRRSNATKAAFCGLEGDKFRDILKKAGIPIEEIWITNLVSCSFVNNVLPPDAASKCYDKCLKAEIAKINPLLIVCLGNVSYDFLKTRYKNVAHCWHPNYITSYKPGLEEEYVKQLNAVYSTFLKKLKFKKICYSGPDKSGKTTLRKYIATNFTQHLASFDRSIIDNIVYDEIYNRHSVFNIDDLEKDALYIFVHNSDHNKHTKIMQESGEKAVDYQIQYECFKKIFDKIKELGFTVIECDTKNTIEETSLELINKIKAVIV